MIKSFSKIMSGATAVAVAMDLHFNVYAAAEQLGVRGVLDDENATDGSSLVQSTRKKVVKKKKDQDEEYVYSGTFILETNSNSWKPILFWKPIQNLETCH